MLKIAGLLKDIESAEKKLLEMRDKLAAESKPIEKNAGDRGDYGDLGSISTRASAAGNPMLEFLFS